MTEIRNIDVYELTFNADRNHFEGDGLGNMYHYWVHPYMKNP